MDFAAQEYISDEDDFDLDDYWHGFNTFIGVKIHMKLFTRSITRRCDWGTFG